MHLLFVIKVVTPSEFYVIRESDRDTLDRLMECIDNCKRRGLRTIKKDEINGGEGLLVFVGAGGVLDRARIQRVECDRKGNAQVAVRISLQLAGDSVLGRCLLSHFVLCYKFWIGVGRSHRYGWPILEENGRVKCRPTRCGRCGFTLQHSGIGN